MLSCAKRSCGNAWYNPTMEKPRIYGLTGEAGKDGFLSPEQQEVLNRLQEKAAVTCMGYLDQRKEDEEYPLVAMATGIGKGNIIHRVIEKQIRRKPASKVLVIAGTKLVLVKQTHEALTGYQQQAIYTYTSNGFDYIGSEEDDEAIQETTTIDSQENPLEGETSFLYTTGKIRQKNVNVHVATIQTVQSEMQKGSLNPEDYELVVVDEVHNIGTDKRKKVVQQFRNVVGFTATPLRYSGRMKTPEQYGFKVVESLPLTEAQELRLLPPLVGIQIDTTSVLEDKIPTTLTGLIDYKKLEKLLKDSPNLRPYIADRLVNIISQGGRNYKTVIAVNFVWEAQELAELLRGKGIKVGLAVNQQAARELDSEEIPALDSIERYKLPESNDKSLQALISPYVLGEGFDAPATEVLVWASPTDSNLRYTQYTGRLARRWEGKRFGVIVDCLYQTSQYNWSYNMGMWMKGHVRVLDSGLLYLGPETDIEHLKGLPQVEGFSKESTKASLEELQKEALLQVQETDFPITTNNLTSTFIGDSRKLKRVAQSIIEEELKKNPDIYSARRGRDDYRIVFVITDRDWFIKAMQTRNVMLQNSFAILEDVDFAVTESVLRNLFGGDGKKLRQIGKKIVEELTEKQPKLISQKKTKNGTVVTVCADQDLFIQKMKDNGFQLKDGSIQKALDDDFIITYKVLRGTFQHSNRQLVNEVILEMQQMNPQWVVTVKTITGGKIVTAIRSQEGQEFFFKRMKEKGIISKKGLERIKPTDFAITNRLLFSVFRGDTRKLRETAEKIMEELKKEDPSLVATRLNVRGKGISIDRVIDVVTERERFIQEMVKRGVELKLPK